MGMLRSVLLALWLWKLAPVTGQSPGWSREPVLELCSAAGDCERLIMAPGHPAKFCAVDADRPPWWAWPFAELRLRLQLEEAPADSEAYWRGRQAAPRFKRTGVPHRGFCDWLGPAIAKVCMDCKEERCEGLARPILGTRDFAAYLPPRGGCVLVEQLPDGVTRARARWEWNWDLFVPACLLLGFVLVDCWRELSASSTVHAAMGGVGSLAFVAVMLLLWITRELRGTVSNVVPFGGTLTALSMFFFTVIPTVREYLISSLWPASTSDWYAYLNARDPFFQLPIGWIVAVVVVLATCGTLSLGANISMKYFASAPEPEGDIPFVIGSDGRRIDALPPVPGPQWMLGWVFWLLGVVLLMFGSHSDTFSLAVFIVIFTKDQVAHLFQQSLMRQSGGSPGSLRPLISMSMFEEQKRHHTQLAIDALQSYVQAHPEAMRHVREESELRLRRFADGGAHCPRFYDFANDEGKRMCTVL